MIKKAIAMIIFLASVYGAYRITDFIVDGGQFYNVFLIVGIQFPLFGSLAYLLHKKDHYE